MGFVLLNKSKLFHIDPVVEKRIHPEALKLLTDWENLELLILPTKLTATDAYGYLNDNERAEFKSRIDQIGEGLKPCMDVGDKVPLYDVYIGDILLKNGIISDFRRTSREPLFSLKSLLEKASKRKLEKQRREAEEAREETKKREEEKRKTEEAIASSTSLGGGVFV